MRIGKRLFPYPVLNSEKLFSQYKNGVFALYYEEGVSEDRQYYQLNQLYCDLSDTMLLDLVNKGKAEIICVVECPSTMYRKHFVVSTQPTDYRIPLADLNNKVNVSAFIVAKEDINDYRSEDFLDDYGDISFSIEKHDILAADDGYVNNVDFNDLDDNKKSSIFIIIKDRNISDGTMQVEYDSDKITISLPEEQWNYYDKTKKIPQYQSLYFSIIAVPALGYALSCLQKNDPAVDILRIDYRWFNAFAIAYKNYHGEEISDDVFIKMNTNLEAQMVLGRPVANAVDEIFGFTIGNIGGDDYAD